MATYTTHKRSAAGKAQTLQRKAARRAKRTNPSHILGTI